MSMSRCPTKCQSAKQLPQRKNKMSEEEKKELIKLSHFVVERLATRKQIDRFCFLQKKMKIAESSDFEQLAQKGLNPL